MMVKKEKNNEFVKAAERHKLSPHKNEKRLKTPNGRVFNNAFLLFFKKGRSSFASGCS